MARQDAVEYIKKIRKLGFRDDEIRRELEKSGWPTEEINLSFIESRVIKMPPAEPAQTIKQPQPQPQIKPLAEKTPVVQKPVPQVPMFEVKKVAPLSAGVSIPINRQASALPPIEKHEPAPLGNAAFLPSLSKEPQSQPINSSPVIRPVVPPPQQLQSSQQAQSPQQAQSQRPAPPLRTQSFSQENVVETLVKEEAAPAGEQRSFAAVSQPRRINTKTIIMSFLALALVASASGGGYWYYQKIYEKQVLATALGALKDMKSYHFDTEVEIRLKDNPARVSEKIDPFIPQVAGLFLHAITPQGQSSAVLPDVRLPVNKFTVRFRGDIDRSDMQKPKYDIFFTLETRDIFLSDIELEGRGVDGTHYFQFTKLPGIPKELSDSGFAPPVDTDSFKKRWVSFNPETIEESLNDYMTRLSAVDASFKPYIVNETKKQQDAPSEEIARIEKLWDSTKIVEWQEDAYPELVKGERAYRFKGVLDKQSLERLIIEMSKIGGKDLSSRDLADISKAVELLGNPEFNIWVSRNTKHILKFTTLASVSDPDAPAKGVAEFLVTTNLSKINEPISVIAPKDSYDFKQVLDSTFDFAVTGLAEGQMRGRDTRRVADVKQIQLALELFLDQNSSYPSSLSLLEPEFIVKLPKDPQSGKSYTYKRLNSKSYTLLAKLEDPNSFYLQNDAKPGDQNYDVKLP